MTIKELSEEVLNKNEKAMHVGDIARQAISMNLTTEKNIEKLTTKISASLANDILHNKNNSNFRRVKNKKGGYKKGIYRLKRKTKSQTEKLIRKITTNTQYVKPQVSTTYIGKGGECAVLSELLFNGYNANIMTVDEGIDIVASKDDKFFYIQVKTTYIKKERLNLPSIKFYRFNQYDKQNTFYIIVLRYYTESNPRNEFLLFRSSDIEKYLATDKIKKENENISMTIKFEEGKILLCNGKNYESIDYHFNNFEIIK